MQSGRFSSEYNLVLIDAIVDRLSVENCLLKIKELNPDYIYSLTGNVSWNSDLLFFESIRRVLPNIKLIVSGDIFLENPVELLKQFCVFDAIVLDYTTNGLDSYLRENRPCEGLVYRFGDEIIDDRVEISHGDEFSIPIPHHALFTSRDYRYPFVQKRPFATVMTEYGCPFHCAFCVMGTLGSKRRPIPDVLDELALIRNLGIRDVFFLDQSFASDRTRGIQLCRQMKDKSPGLRWLCFSRVDLLDEELILEMKAAGCHSMILGVETASPELLTRYRKGYSLDQVREIFGLLRRKGIRSIATFLLGLPGESWASAIRTIEFARELDCDFASINVAAPRMGTDLRRWAIDGGFISDSTMMFDQSGSQIVMNSSDLSAEDLAKLKRIAVRRIYLRPRFLLRRLLSLRSVDECAIQTREGFHLLKRYFQSILK